MKEQIRVIINATTDCYLNTFLQKLPIEKHSQAIECYDRDLNRIIDFCYENIFIDEFFIITEDFIKGLHRSLYPVGYVQKYTNSRGKEDIWMIPGEYKKIDIESTNSVVRDIYTKPNRVVAQMQEVIKEYNKNLLNLSNQAKIRDLILDFIIKIASIHPFGDGNGRLCVILGDLLCFKYGIKPFYLQKIKEIDKQGLYKAVSEVRKNGDLKIIYDFIEKYSQ